MGPLQILIFDEATSALDSESERLVQDGLQLKIHGCTMIFVAHRLSTIRDVDKIYVLFSGCLAEEGTHAELMKKRGLYYRLARAQQVEHQITEQTLPAMIKGRTVTY